MTDDTVKLQMRAGALKKAPEKPACVYELMVCRVGRNGEAALRYYTDLVECEMAGVEAQKAGAATRIQHIMLPTDAKRFCDILSDLVHRLGVKGKSQ